MSNVLSENLAAYVSEADLVRNAAEYPEMATTFSGSDGKRLAATKEHLLNVPLLHTVKNLSTLYEIDSGGLMPSSSHPNPANTYPIDRSLGLDDYAFTTWGEQGPQEYGRYGVMFCPAEVLENSVVTPGDLCEFVNGPELRLPFDEQTSERQARIRDKYLSKMVIGSAWHEIIARRIVLSLAKHGDNRRPIMMGSPMALGEVKHHGPMEPGLIGGTVNVVPGGYDSHLTQTDFEEMMIDLGFVPRSIESACVASWATAEQRASASERSKGAMRVWRSILAIE